MCQCTDTVKSLGCLDRPVVCHVWTGVVNSQGFWVSHKSDLCEAQIPCQLPTTDLTSKEPGWSRWCRLSTVSMDGACTVQPTLDRSKMLPKLLLVSDCLSCPDCIDRWHAVWHSISCKAPKHQSWPDVLLWSVCSQSHCALPCKVISMQSQQDRGSSPTDAT